MTDLRSVSALKINNFVFFTATAFLGSRLFYYLSGGVFVEAYFTIAEQSNGEYDEKRSRFLAVAIPCSTEEEVTRHLADLRSKYWDARHNVYAYILQNGASRFSDDGEPHGTAGKPVLDVLAGSGFTDVLIVVTRYFGGVLLGTGGLVRAYSTSAKAAIEAAVRVKMCPCTSFEINCPYTDHQRLLRLLENHHGNIVDTEYAADITLKFTLQQEDIEPFKSALIETFAARLTAKEGKSEFAPVFLK